MAAELITLSEQWIRDKLQLTHPSLADVRSLSLPGTYEQKIQHLGTGLKNFIRLKSLDLSCNGLVSIEGVQCLKTLERLILYYNAIPSLEELKVLHELPRLRELDVRLNPLTKTNPHYRPYIVHAIPKLRKLDGCPVRDTDRKVAIMKFLSDDPPQKKDDCVNESADKRISSQRLALVDRICRSLSLQKDSDDMVLNVYATSPEDQTETCVQQDPKRKKQRDFTGQRSSTPKLDVAKSILRHPSTIHGEKGKSSIPQEKAKQNDENAQSFKVTEKPKVSFGPYIEKSKPLFEKLKIKDSKQTRRVAKGHFTPNPDQMLSSSFGDIRPPSPCLLGTNLSNPANPVLHPPRLTYSSIHKTEDGSTSQQEGKKKKGSYRKPLEMLLNLVDKHWRGEKSLHQNNNFLSQAVQILSLMESSISSRENEIKTLRQQVDALNSKAAAKEERHEVEVQKLSSQLEEAHATVGKLNEQLRIVLEENVSLQKQLIKVEKQYLKSMIRSSPRTQIQEAQMEVEDLRREIEILKERVYKSEHQEIVE
uniref:Centrosomal protein of 72 kDa n=1 Tax=Neogobius melanostomus TaxID=47308 RepID=A0A8C6SXV2_9GOBI